MELVLKIPKGKPPFIGILFNDRVEAGKKNINLITHNSKAEYELILDPGQKLHITLYDNNGFSDKYEVNYEPISLLKFIHATKESPKFTFGHLSLFDSKMEVAKTMGGFQMVFRIKAIKVSMLVIEK